MSDQKPKYPHSKKSIFTRLKEKFSPPKCVYAGPERKDPASAVYAGPEYYERKRPVGRVYAGPAPRPGNTEGPVNEVYAGPEFFEEDPGKAEPEEPSDETPSEGRIPEKENGNGADPTGPTALVYGGPAYFRPAPEMPVYAGPQFFDSDDGSAQSAPIPEMPGDPAPEVFGSGRYTCASCASKFDGPFCPVCGSPRKNEGPVSV